MSCPDEDTFTRMQAGLLSPSEMAGVHRHLDNCPACLELAGVLGCLNDNGPAPNDAGIGGIKVILSALAQPDYRSTLGATAPQLQSRKSLLAFCVITVAHAYFGLSLNLNLWRATGAGPVRALITSKFGYIGLIGTLYLSLWGLVGFAWACLGCWALLTDRRWARRVARTYALLSLPTIALTPLSICVLVALHRPRNYLQNLHDRTA